VENKKSGAQVIVSDIAKYSRRIFVYPGGTVAPILDEAIKQKVELLTARTEQGAGFAAIGASKISESVEFILVSSGPGVTNVVTPIADAYYDSTPIVAICGQVGQSDFKGSKPIRQGGFQEVDTESIMGSITKKTITPQSVSELEGLIAIASQIALSGRPGPVVINLHMNLQREIIESGFDKELTSNQIFENASDFSLNKKDFSLVFEKLTKSKRPLVIAGHGTLSESNPSRIRDICKKLNIPVSHSLLSLGVMPGDIPLNLGFHGHTGSRIAGKAIADSDFILVLGSRLDVRQTGTLKEEFGKNAFKVRVEIDSDELANSRIKADLNFNMPVSNFLRIIEEGLLENNLQPFDSWTDKYEDDETYVNEKFKHENSSQINPYLLISELSKIVEDRNVTIVSGVGSHQQWVARSFDFDIPRTNWLTSGGLGTMGYDLPVAIGASLASRETTTICFVGDGSFQMNIQELAFASEFNIPIKIVVLDNKKLGIVSQFQLLNWGEDPTCGNKNNPEFTQIAGAYGLPSRKIITKEHILENLNWLIDQSGPALLHVAIPDDIDVLPMLLAGDSTNRMWPYES
jgi:acetolactate synthase-1/2/3 large subunit